MSLEKRFENMIDGLIDQQNSLISQEHSVQGNKTDHSC